MSLKASERAAKLLAADYDERQRTLLKMSDAQRRSLETHWEVWAHQGQLPPQGPWATWLIMAGRGFGKTRAGAEWMRTVARDPLARIALVAASLGEARSVMVEGDSGILAVCPPRERPRFEPSRRLLTWRSGAQATLYSAGEPESLRGPQHSHACRAGAEGILRQPGPRIGRHAVASGGRRDRHHSAAHTTGGQAWLVGSSPTGAWEGQAGAMAAFEAGTWLFITPREGMQLFDKSTAQYARYSGGWQRATAPAAPTGGTVVDSAARAAIVQLIEALASAGILPDA